MSDLEHELKRRRPLDEQADFVMSFVEDSRDSRQDMDDIWDEVESSFLVRPFTAGVTGTENPLGLERRGRGPFSARLKDTATHQAVMTIVSMLMTRLYPDHGFVKSRPVGFEDVFAADVVNKLIEHAHRLEGNFLATMEWLLSMCTYGSGILQAAWRFEEGARSFRAVEIDEFGFIDSSSEVLTAPVFDDVQYMSISPRDFFPDHGESCTQFMQGCAKRFRVAARTALNDDRYKTERVKKAIVNREDEEASQAEDRPSDFEADLDPRKKSFAEFGTLTGFEYYGQVPFGVDDGIHSRVITVLNGETVRNEPWPRRIPFFECKIIPRLGGFWGISPGEVIRHDQDFLDTLKSMLATAVIRMTHPSPVVDRSKVRATNEFVNQAPDKPIKVDGDPRTAVAWPDFRPPLQEAFVMMQQVQNQTQQASSATDILQGLGLGTKRASASEFVGSRELAEQRPEFFAVVMERAYLPSLGRYTLGLYQEFLEEGTDDLQRRIGSTEVPVDVDTILPDYDVEFVGSRFTNELAAFREIFQASANPIVAQLIPWVPFLREYFNAIGAGEIAAQVANPEMLQLNILLSQLSAPGQQAGNGNGNVAQPNPLGLLPTQAAGETAV